MNPILPLWKILTSVGGLSGQSVLESALAWGSTLDQTVVSEDVTATFSGVFGGVLTPGAPDPDGGSTGYYFADTNGVNNRPGARMTTTGGTTGARYTYEYHTRFDPAYAGTRWNGNFVYLQTPDTKISNVILPNASDGTDGRLAYFGPYDILRADMLKLSNNWVRVRIRDTLQGNFTVQSANTYLQAGETIGQITEPRVYRDSVSAQTNLATGSAATITQATAANRPETALDPWIDGEDVIFTDGHDAWLDVSEIPALLSGASKAWSFGAMLDFRKHFQLSTSGVSTGPIFRLIGATASLSINQTASGLEVVRTDDAASITTAAMPFAWLEEHVHALTLTCDGANIQLHIDGVALGAPQAIGTGTATFTSARVYGASRVAMGEWAVWDYELSVQEVAAQAAKLATRRGTSTAPIQLWWGVGQSNGDTTGPSLYDVPLSDQFPNSPGSLFVHRSLAAPSTSTLGRWGAPRGCKFGSGSDYRNATTFPAINRANFTIAVGFAATRGRHALMSYAKGGTPLENFLSTGAEWATMTAFWDTQLAALAAAGVRWVAAGLVDVHGEADSATLARATTFGTKLEQLRTDIETEYGVTLPIVAVPRVHVDLDPVASPYSTELRANLAAWELADPDHRWAVNVDDQTLKVDNVHYSNTMTIEVGKRLGAPSNRVKDL